MKPAIYTIYYVVYPPHYEPGDGYKTCKNKQAAFKQCRKKSFGVGSEVVRQLEISNKRMSSYSTPGRYLGKFGWRYDKWVYTEGK